MLVVIYQTLYLKYLRLFKVISFISVLFLICAETLSERERGKHFVDIILKTHLLVVGFGSKLRLDDEREI